jgi:hypothetical protein
MTNKRNFIVHLRELPGTSLSYFNIKKHYALEAAKKAAPGFSFDIREVPDTTMRAPLVQIARAPALGFM